MNYVKANGRLIVAISRFELTLVDINVPFAWITITCPKHEHLDKLEKAEYVLAMKFVDLDIISFPGIINAENLFTQEDANTIVDFVNSIPPKTPIIVNCLAGLSRSTAVAAAIAYCSGGDDSIFWEKTCPNRFVFQTLCKAFGKEPPERSWTGIPNDDFFTFDEDEIY
jgi:hypothetical protein